MLAIIKQFVSRMLMGKGKGILQIPPHKAVDDFANDLYKKFKQNGVSDEAITNPKDVKIVWEQITNREAQIFTNNLKDALQKPDPFKKAGEVFDLKGKKIKNPQNMMGGEEIIETDAEILARLKKVNKESLSNMRYEAHIKVEEAKAAADEDYIMKVFDPEDFSKGGRAGYKDGLGPSDQPMMGPVFETNDPKEAAKEVIKRLIKLEDVQIPFDKKLSLVLGPDLESAEIKGVIDILGGELNFGAGMKNNEPGFGFNFTKQFAAGGVAGLLGERTEFRWGGPGGKSPGTSSSGGTRGGPGPGGQGARGQATQNPGRTTRSAPAPTYQNVHQTGAVTQTPGRTVSTGGPPGGGDPTMTYTAPKTGPVTTGGQSPFGYTKPEPKSYNYGINNITKAQKFKKLNRLKNRTLNLNKPSKKFGQLLAETPMHLFGLDPDLAGVSQDPSLLELSDIKNARLSPEKYFETSQYGLQEDLMEKGPFGTLTGWGAALAGPALSATVSPIYDTLQAVYRSAKDPNLNFGQALKNENIWESTKGRTLGSAKFLADQLGIGNFRKEMVNNITPQTSFADGGPARQNFGLGGISRRAFLKWMAGAGAGIGAAKSGLFSLLKGGGKKAAVDLVTTPNVAGKPVWFDALVNKVIKEGDDVSKKFGTKDLEVVHTKRINDLEEVTVTRELDTGDILVEYGPHMTDETGKVIRASNEPGVVRFQYKKGEEIYDTGKGHLSTRKSAKEPDTFNAVESEPRITDWDGTIEMDGENVVNNVDELLTDTNKLKQYATGKNPTIRELLDGRKKQKYKQTLEENPSEQINYIEKREGMSADDILDQGAAQGDYGKMSQNYEIKGINLPVKKASGGRVPLSGGLIVKGGNWFLKSLRGTREAIKNNKEYSPERIKQYLNQIDNEIKNIESGGKIPDEVIQTIRSDPKFKGVWQNQKSADPDLREIEEVLLEYGQKHAEGGRASLADGKKVTDPGYFMFQDVDEDRPFRYEYDASNPEHIKIITDRLKKKKQELIEAGLLEQKIFSEKDRIPADNYFLESIQNFPTENTPKELEEIKRNLRLKQELKEGGRASLSAGGLAGMLGE